MLRSFMLVAMSGAVLLAAADSHDLLVAIRSGDHQQAQRLLRSGAEVKGWGQDGTTALMHAVIESDARMMSLLIENGASVNAKNALDSTARMYAATTLAKP